MYKTLFPNIGTKFPTTGTPRLARQSVSFPTVWRDDVPDDLTPTEIVQELIYLVDKDGNLLLDMSGNKLTIGQV